MAYRRAIKPGKGFIPIPLYPGGALASKRFNYLGRMLVLHKSYYSQELFPLFANRILNRSRPEYPDYLRWLALQPGQDHDPMYLLGRSGGQRATDELCVYPHPETNMQGDMELFFMSHGLRHLDSVSLQRIVQLHHGDPLTLRKESDNRHDYFALLLETDESIMIGYCPRYLSRDMCKIFEQRDVNLTVERLNLDAPLQFRLLCKAAFKLPQGIELFADEEYQLLEREGLAA